MPTIKDIAKIAGVSHGTVSNVLNGRGNVSVKKIKLVELAAQKLGYQFNLSAKVLKEGYTKTISVVLPNITSEQYNCLYDGLFNDLSSHGYELSLYITHDSKERELQLIQKIAAKRDCAIITVSCLVDANPYYQTIKTPKDSIIFVYRKPFLAEQFISLDFERAGQDIAVGIMAKNYRNIGLFTNSTSNAPSCGLKNGLQAAFNQSQYNVVLNHIESMPSESNYTLAFSFFSDLSTKYDAIITSDIERANYIKNANFLGSNVKCPTIYTLTNDVFFYSDNCYKYHMNYGMLSQQIINIITGKEVNYIDNKGFLFFTNERSKRQQAVCNKMINFLILPSPTTEAVRKLLPHFKKETGIDVNLIVKPFDDIYRQFNELEQYPEIDVVRIDMASLPWFAKSLLMPLTELNLNLDELLSHYSTQIIERFSYINDIAYAMPFDPSIQVLFYRQDLFSDPLIKRQYFEKYRENLVVPTDFAQFSQISKFFNQRFNRDSPVRFGSSVTLGNSEIIASEFLLRYYANGGRLIDKTCVGLDKEIAQSTLNEFKSFITIANNLDAAWWQTSVEQFEQGDLAMLIVYMNLFSYISNKNILPLINCASVPGNHPLFGGGSLGMSRYSKKTDEVSQFFNWIFSKEISEQIALLGGSITRDDILQNQKIINSYPWIKRIEENYSRGIRENQLESGQSINLRKVESIIGEYIGLWLNDGSSKSTINKINRALKHTIVP
ncbi:extracellular solute-binding protein [Orbus wheelerorum]|uniref:extracellular solute-binding protein n=1 Tax=Orbus wheelerorum TaxID=3074111 RepID=UPI00370D3F26